MAAKSEVLNSWKEIAAYMGRGVRTVQRWEHDLRLPVHRPKGRDRSAVLAFPGELDYWLLQTPVRTAEDLPPPPVQACRNEVVRRSRELCQQARLLRADIHRRAQSQSERTERLTAALSNLMKRMPGAGDKRPA